MTLSPRRLAAGCLFVATLALPVPGRAQGGAGTCGCDDVQDLLNRINIAHAAIEKYKEEIPAIFKAGSVTAVGNYELLQQSVVVAQAGVQVAAARDATGKTDLLCEVDTKADTACLKEVVDLHEAVHQVACLAEKKRRGLGRGDDRMVGKTLVEAVREEIEAYELEIQAALLRLRTMPAACRPHGWVGTITVLEVKRLAITNTTPPPPGNRFALGSTDSTDQQTSRFGTIYYASGVTTGYMKSEQLDKQGTVSRMRVGCTGGLARREADQVQTNTYHAEIQGTGFTDKIPPLSFNAPPDQRRYAIGFTIPAIASDAATFSGFTSSAGGCNDETKPFPVAAAMTTSLDATPLTVEGTLAPRARDASGSKSFDMLPRGGIPGTTGSHRIEVRWNLHQID